MGMKGQKDCQKATENAASAASAAAEAAATAAVAGATAAAAAAAAATAASTAASAAAAAASATPSPKKPEPEPEEESLPIHRRCERCSTRVRAQRKILGRHLCCSGCPRDEHTKNCQLRMVGYKAALRDARDGGGAK